MILIPVIGRTRSSLVAGIFHHCGAWVGDTTVSMINRYDTFENWDVIHYLQKKYSMTYLMPQKRANADAPDFRRWCEANLPNDRVVCLKFVYYYEPLFRAAFPESEYFYVKRTDNLGRRKLGGRRFVDYVHKMSPRDGKWIDTTRLPGMMIQMRRIVAEHPNLEWDEHAIQELIKNGVDRKFMNIRKVHR